MTSGLVVALNRLGSTLDAERGVLDPFGIAIEYASDDPAARAQQLLLAEAVLVNKTKIDGRFFDAAPRCRAVVTYGVGHDHIDLAEAERRDVMVAHVPDYCTEEVADHTMALFLALARGIARGDALVRAGGWGVDGLGPFHRIRGRLMGLVGFGRIARAVAVRARAFGLTVAVYDPLFPPARGDGAITFLDSLESLLRVADVVSLHAPLLPGTRNLIGTGALRLMKPGSILINTSRGGLVDLPALLRALADGRLAGAGLDVFPDEPPHDLPLAGGNLILTPHIAYYSAESEQELKVSAATAVAAALTGAPVANQLTRTPTLRKEPVG